MNIGGDHTLLQESNLTVSAAVQGAHHVRISFRKNVVWLYIWNPMAYS